MTTNIPSILEFYGSQEQIEEVKNFLRGKPDKEGYKMHIDFNNIVRMPEDLNIEHDFYAELAQLLLFGKGWEDTPIEEAQEVFSNLDGEAQTQATKLAIDYQRNYHKFGHTTKESWRFANWGTKMNACNQYMPDDNTIWFDSVDNPVNKLLKALSGKFPEVEFQYVYEVENKGTYGKVRYKNGEVDVVKPVAV